MLIWLLQHDYIDGALASFVNPEVPWKAEPGLVRNVDDVIASAGSRYTYSANTLALKQAQQAGLSRLALVGWAARPPRSP